MAEQSLGAGALVLIGTAGVDGTVGLLDHLLAIPLASSIGVTGVRSAAHALQRFVDGPVVSAIDGWGSRAGRASRGSSGRCCASATCSRPGSTRSWCRRPWSSAAVTGS